MPATTIPFGPQHPVLPEPIHLSLTVENEKVVDAVPALGYVHRGLEGLVSVRDIDQMVLVVERVCGICSCIHAMCFCHCIEELMGVEVPPRARFLRTIWSELHRIHSHLLWLGLFADAFGFESVFMQFWKIREKVMDINEGTAGNRVIVSVNVVGGVRRDLDREGIDWIMREMAVLQEELHRLEKVMLADYTVCRRTRGVAVLTAEQALELGVVGPTLRGSGVAQDTRQLGYEVFDELGFTPVTAEDGDCWARARVRFLETRQSVDIVRECLARLPRGELAAKVKGRPRGEVVRRVEQPRGELLYCVKADGTKHLERLHIRTPTFANIPALTAMLPGAELADVPVVVLSIDPCISCTER
jgi:ech hydrogenase subunit E